MRCLFYPCALEPKEGGGAAIIQGSKDEWGRAELLSSVFYKMLSHILSSEEKILNIKSYT